MSGRHGRNNAPLFGCEIVCRSVVSTDQFENQAARLFDSSGCYIRKREDESGRDFKERRTRNRGYAIEEMKSLNDKHFKKMFRLNRSAFYYLLVLIKKHLEPGCDQ